jgi:hypothetical protein
MAAFDCRLLSISALDWWQPLKCLLMGLSKAALDCWWLHFSCSACPCLLVAVIDRRWCLLKCMAALDWVYKLQFSLITISHIPSTTQHGSELHHCNIIFPSSSSCLSGRADGGTETSWYIYIYIPIYLINSCAFEGRAEVCFGVLPGYDGVT